MELEKDVGLISGNLLEENSDDNNMVTMPTPMGGMRRKHHRPWSLTEVVKLVEGVARYGAGRWSEIKRLAFASYSYRTSVDLKVCNLVILSCKAVSEIVYGVSFKI